MAHQQVVEMDIEEPLANELTIQEPSVNGRTSKTPSTFEMN